MRHFLLFYLLGLSFCCFAQNLRFEQNKISEQIDLIYTRYNSDSTLTIQQKDSLYGVYLELGERLHKLYDIGDSIIQIAAKMNVEASRLYSLLENNEVSSATERDSLDKVLAHLMSRAEAIESKLRFIPDKLDSLDQVFAKIDDHQLALDQAIKYLIHLVSDPDAYYLVQIDGIKKLARSRHPAALAFLMDNLMSFAGNGDPTIYGASHSFYVWPENHPCYEYLVEYINTGYNMGWHLLPDFNRVLNQQLIPEKYINLYATLLNYITQTCKPCRDVWLEDYLKQTEGQNHVKNGRANVLQIIEYYRNPKK